jgi:beta-lactam-binding protein with PASTA domain
MVIDAGVIGQQARPLVRRMRQAGLVPKVEWSYDGQVPAGTIIAIKPEGDLGPGTVVTVTVAAPESE